ncbi:hypothetical protein CKO15_04505 [Halorhodospira abdelmalekii]|uniref:TetR/AcrR family transcriptional regulator n=1 Tax=Halorhodospira abdelmalekii TaxID=421629 RepID=UPI0019082BBF|nr:TetR/AcrR family transcriptional regulator [Halorhodospira abdelmalekii]MBK1734557.1 hypothetical protein [Halorhodospira abdelmalekii]
MSECDQAHAKKRTRLPPDERKEQILRAAGPYFAEHGYASTDVQAIADRIGVGKGTIYRHFSSKEELFLATVQRAVERLSESIDARVEATSDPLDKLKAAVYAYLEFFDAYPGVVELFIQERAEFRTQAPPIYFAHSARERAKWRPLHDALIARGDARALSFDDVADIIGNTLFGAAFKHRLAGDDGALVERAEATLEVILHGILRPDARSRERSEPHRDRR